MTVTFRREAKAALVLADGTAFVGHGLGAPGAVVGELVFNTAMTGYQEILTDPSYAGQLITFTFPHIGNVGTNDEDIEAPDCHARGVVLRAPITDPSNFRALQHLDRWLEARGLVGIAGIDTRRVTRRLRDTGAQTAALGFERDRDPDIVSLAEMARAWPGMEGMDLASEVSCAQRYTWDETIWRYPDGYGRLEHGRYHVVAVDYGIKRNILRSLAGLGVRLTVVPATTAAEAILALEPDGIFLSNGPGDPAATGRFAVPEIKKLIASGKPLFGICLGHQMLALALGGRTEKMKFGHHGANHPVKDMTTGKVEITSQNHGFAVRPESLPDNVVQTHVSLFDGSLEGLSVKDQPVFSVQYHPEASPGPQDSAYLFERFLRVDRERLMPKRTDIESILVIGAGPIVIGQACEFDYSGTQAVKALKAEGYRVVLVNSNPATIMTDPELADATYIEPITPEILAKVIERERPDACLPTMGGQTALNAARALSEDGTFARYGVELIGASREAIAKAEDRQLFREAMSRIGLEMPRSVVVRSLAEAPDALAEIGFPAIIRPSYTLGGTGGGIAYNREEFQAVVATGLDASPIREVLIEESVLGWKEYEMEVVRDRADNCIIVCSIENVDPMGVHTGDSITVAPALTLTDKEYQRMRNASIAVLREIGVDTGGSNVQFAVDPVDGRMVIIEMNPRVSRSSALASKATGFPIAKVAARLAVGYTLDEIINDITGCTPASFEPTIDYVVTKVPRFTFEKFPETEPILTTSMKSVGEVMAIGRTFAESLQKALRSLEIGLEGLDEIEVAELDDHEGPKEAIRAALRRPTPERIRVIAQAFRAGLGIEAIHAACHYDPWFLEQIQEIVAAEERVRRQGLGHDRQGLLELKAMGFSDARLAELTGSTPAAVAARRLALGVHPVFKRIDTCAAEFEARTPYLYSCYETGLADDAAAECEAAPSERRKVIILGGGPNRIGQGIEFDYCCVHAVFGLADAGLETIMINCNPETVSTDYDTSDRLYFEPLTTEDVLEIVRVEASRGQLCGVIVQLGGQTPLKLAQPLADAGVPILGTSPDAIDLAEDRQRFQELLHRLGLRQPDNAICHDREEALRRAERIGFPLVIRPSYVLGGRAMRIVHDASELGEFMVEAAQLTELGPILIDRYLEDAIEIDVDLIADAETVFVAGIMEHIEEAGIHSGDSACSLPPHSLAPDILDEIRRQAEILARALEVRGLMNLQLAIKDRELFILEVNPRASRTVPFVAKAIGQPIAKIAARVMAGERLASFGLQHRPLDHVAVKEAIFPFARFPGVDLLLGPEMKSTGEVMGLDRRFGAAFAKSQLGVGNDLPAAGTVFISVRDRDKPAMVELGRLLLEQGYKLIATDGTAAYLRRSGLEVEVINKVHQGRPHVVDRIKDGGIAIVLNTTEGRRAIRDSYTLRRAALTYKIPYYTTVAGARAVVQAMTEPAARDLAVAPLQSYY